jgi:DNA-binding transcriptional LysR family regulator
MKLQQLKILEAISRHSNVTVAAEELHLSQPAASLQLKLLEQEFNLELFRRNNHGMELTQDGRDFLMAACLVLRSADDLERRFKPSRRGSNQDAIVFGANHTLSAIVLPEVLTRFRCHQPDIRLELEVSDSASVENDVEQLRVDLALISRPKHLPNCNYEPFLEIRYETAVVVNPDTPFASEIASLDDLLRCPLVVKVGGPIVEHLQSRGHKLNLAFRCNAPEAARMTVLRGLGVGLLPRTWVQFEIEKGTLKEIAIPQIEALSAQSFLVWNKRRILNGGMEDLLRVIRDYRSEKSDLMDA